MWAIVITRCPSSVVVNFSHFRLLLIIRWTDFNETLQEASPQRPLPSLGWVGLGWLRILRRFNVISVISRLGSGRYPISEIIVAIPGLEPRSPAPQAKRLTTTPPPLPLPSLCFSCRSEVQDGRPGLWLAETFFDFFSPTAEWILTKLGRKQVLNALYKLCVFCADRKSKMAALASDWLKHFSTSSLQRLNGFWRNLTGSKSSTSSTKFVFFVPIGNPRWPPCPLIGWNIFRLLLRNRWMDFYETWQEASPQCPLWSRITPPGNDVKWWKIDDYIPQWALFCFNVIYFSLSSHISPERNFLSD